MHGVFTCWVSFRAIPFYASTKANAHIYCDLLMLLWSLITGDGDLIFWVVLCARLTEFRTLTTKSDVQVLFCPALPGIRASTVCWQVTSLNESSNGGLVLSAINRPTRRETCPCATLSIEYLTWTGPWIIWFSSNRAVNTHHLVYKNHSANSV